MRQSLIVSGLGLVKPPHAEPDECLDMRQLKSKTGHGEFPSLQIWPSGGF